MDIIYTSHHHIIIVGVWSTIRGERVDLLLREGILESVRSSPIIITLLAQWDVGCLHLLITTVIGSSLILWVLICCKSVGVVKLVLLRRLSELIVPTSLINELLLIIIETVCMVVIGVSPSPYGYTGTLKGEYRWFVIELWLHHRLLLLSSSCFELKRIHNCCRWWGAYSVSSRILHVRLASSRWLLKAWRIKLELRRLLSNYRRLERCLLHLKGVVTERCSCLHHIHLELRHNRIGIRYVVTLAIGMMICHRFYLHRSSPSTTALVFIVT